MTETATITLGYMTRKTSPTGATFLQGDIGNLRITIIAEPRLEPSATGDMVYRVVARQTPRSLQRQAWRRSALPSGDPFDLAPVRQVAPAPQGAPAEPRVAMREKLSKAARLDAAAADAIARNGAIPRQGDRIDDLFPAPAQAAPDDEGELQAAIDLLHRPII